MAKWTDNTIEIVDGDDEGNRAHRVAFEGDGVTTDFDLPHLDTKAHIAWEDSVPVSSHGYEVLVGEGESGGDRLSFNTAPADGAVLLVRYGWQGSPRGPFLSTRRPVDIPVTKDDRYIVSNGLLSLWEIAGRPEVYNDATRWWALVDVNDELNDVFQAQFGVVPAGTILRVPPWSKVVEALEV